MNNELIIKYFRNNCSEEELIAVLAWFEKLAETTDGKSILFNTWEEMADDEKQTPDLENILHQIHHQVNLKKTEGILSDSLQVGNQYRKREYYIKRFTRVAAVLLIPILIYGVYISYKYNFVKQQQAQITSACYEVTSSPDAITKVTLPDGTSVWLNYGSTLKYPALFKGNTRMVELMGEGYFEVAHNTKMPFIVRTGDIEVIARGTTFNIAAYSDDDLIETSLINGKVEIDRIKPNGDAMSLLNMKPNDMTIYNKASHETKSFVIEDDRNYSWKEGKLTLIDEPISEVTKLLGRRYNANFTIKDQKLHELTFSATLVNESLPEVMKLLSIAMPMNYTLTEPEKLDDGTYSKREVILSYRRR